MQIHIAVNDALIDEVLMTTEFKTTEEAIEQGLKLLLQLRKREKTKALYSGLAFFEECRRQSLLLKNDKQEQETQRWLESVADNEGWA